MVKASVKVMVKVVVRVRVRVSFVAKAVINTHIQIRPHH